MSWKRTDKGQFAKGSHWRAEKPFWDRAWCIREYKIKKRSAGDIAKEFGVTDASILFWLNKHGIKRRSVSEARKVKHWGALGSDNPMWNKRGELNPNWKGGITPERQEFYQSQAWKDACSAVWKRDKATCQRCGQHRESNLDMPFHIHHIIGFEVIKMRARRSNLVLLCEVCHNFVHSNQNTKRDFLDET